MKCTRCSKDLTGSSDWSSEEIDSPVCNECVTPITDRPHASDCAVWVNEPCDCGIGKYEEYRKSPLDPRD